MTKGERNIQQFTEWLDKHEIEYDVVKSFSGQPRVYVNYPDGWYIRVSEFDNGFQWYVRDNGMVYWTTVFELADRILEQKDESAANVEKAKNNKLSDVQKAWLKGDMKAVGDILDKPWEEREKKMELTNKQVLASMSGLPVDAPESEHIRKIMFG